METKSSPKKCESRKKVKEPSPNRCVLPEDIIMACILTRLPVKSIVRFKSVCKPWLQLFSTPEFVKSHRAQFSSDPKNESIIFYELNFIPGTPSLLSLLNPDPKDKELTTIVHSLNIRDFVGCCNGLVCVLVCDSDLEEVIHLWNPAMRLVKRVGYPESMSLGFGYDAERDDYKVVRILCESGVEVYSANSDSWTKIEVGFEFHVEREKNDVIVNGNPYWVGMVGGDVVLLCFDVTRMVLKTVPMPLPVPLPLPRGVRQVNMGGLMDHTLVDLNGALGVIGWDDASNERLSLDTWVFGDGDRIWRKTNRLRNIRVICSIWMCLKNGNFVGERFCGTMFVVDPDNGCVDEIDAPESPFEVYGYTESLTQIDGMIKQVTGREFA